jgi:hypothetical protein
MKAADLENLASRIAELAERDRYTLSLIAEVKTRSEIASLLIRDQQTLKRDVQRILNLLPEVEPAKVWAVLRPLER